MFCIKNLFFKGKFNLSVTTKIIWICQVSSTRSFINVNKFCFDSSSSSNSSIYHWILSFWSIFALSIQKKLKFPSIDCYDAQSFFWMTFYDYLIFPRMYDLRKMILEAKNILVEFVKSPGAFDNTSSLANILLSNIDN